MAIIQSISGNLAKESLSQLYVVELVFALVHVPHQLDVVDVEAEHLRDASEVLQLNLAGLFFIDDHAEFHGLLDLFPLLVFASLR